MRASIIKRRKVYFIPVIDKNFLIIEKLLGLKLMKNTPTGQELFECAVYSVDKNALSRNRISNISIDGAGVSTGKM